MPINRHLSAPLDNEKTVRFEVTAQAHAAPAREGLTLLQLLAIVVLLAAGIVGLFLGSIPLAIGAGLAAILLLLPDPQVKHWLGGRQAEAAMPPPPPPIESPADGANPLYKGQPDHMVPKYQYGGAGTGERQ